MSDQLHDACDVCGAQPGNWCEPWCSEQPNPALRVPDKDEQIATLTAERDALERAYRTEHGGLLQDALAQLIEAIRWETRAAVAEKHLATLRAGLREACDELDRHLEGEGARQQTAHWRALADGDG